MGLIGHLVRGFPGTSAVYVEDLRSGHGAAYNARARFSAGSTLKLAIAVAVLRALHGPPRPGSSVSQLMDAMLLQSDNASANDLADLVGGGYVIDEMLRTLGLYDTEMDGSYIVGPRAKVAPIPIGITSQPYARAGEVHDRLRPRAPDPGRRARGGGQGRAPPALPLVHARGRALPAVRARPRPGPGQALALPAAGTSRSRTRRGGTRPCGTTTGSSSGAAARSSPPS